MDIDRIGAEGYPRRAAPREEKASAVRDEVFLFFNTP